MVAPRITDSLIRRYISEGRGLGHGEAYSAFIQLARWNASPVSVQTFGRVPPFDRSMHFLSRSEWLIALLLSWVGCQVREQFPMWPWESPSPLYGYNSDIDARLPWSSGTLELCRRAGINHGCFVGTIIPYIWTLDLVATLAWLPAETVSAAVVSVKPLSSEAYTGDVDPIARGPEKLEVERRFAEEIDLAYFVADRDLFPGALLGQLELYSSAAFIPRDHRIEAARNALLDARAGELELEPPICWRDRLVRDHHLALEDADIAVHSIFWHQLLDVDLTREVQMEDVLRPGGWALKERLRHALVEATPCRR